VLVAIGVAAILVTVSYTTWQRYTAQQRLRYAAIQVASSLRQAEERAKAERVTYTVAFTASSSNYIIARSSGGFQESALLPTGVTPQAADTVTFSAFGQPDAAHTVTLQNLTGTRTASIDSAGGITYQGP
jgi:Tfp pilus assembly protein FimT